MSNTDDSDNSDNSLLFPMSPTQRSTRSLLPSFREQEVDNWVVHSAQHIQHHDIPGPSYEIRPTSPIGIPPSSSRRNVPPQNPSSDDISDVSAAENLGSDSLQLSMSPASVDEQSLTDIPTPPTDDQTPVVPENAPAVVAEPTLLNPSDGASFSFVLKPARVLKWTIAVLTGDDFNVDRRGYIDVDKEDFKFIVNSSSGAIGVLSLSSTGLIDFKCRQPFSEPQMVRLIEISEGLSKVDDNATVLVYQLDGSPTLSFETSVPSEGFSVHIYTNTCETKPQISRYRKPDGPVIYGLDSVKLIEDLIKAAKPAVVSVEIVNGQATIQVTDEDKWRNECEEFKKHLIIMGRPENSSRRAWFKWSHVEALRMAHQVLPGFTVRFLSCPASSVGFQFSLGTAGYLMLLKEALEIYPAL